jgi:transcriptional regulator with XRE-family HTH domain
MDINRATALAIASERAIADMTIRQLSDASGVPLTTLVTTLRGDRDIKVKTVAKLAAAMNIPAALIHQRAAEIMDRERRADQG